MNEKIAEKVKRIKHLCYCQQWHEHCSLDDKESLENAMKILKEIKKISHEIEKIMFQKQEVKK